jgi:hypothetical protein
VVVLKIDYSPKWNSPLVHLKLFIPRVNSAIIIFYIFTLLTRSRNSECQVTLVTLTTSANVAIYKNGPNNDTRLRLGHMTYRMLGCVWRASTTEYLVVSLIWSVRRVGDLPLPRRPSRLPITTNLSRLSSPLRTMWPKNYTMRRRHMVERRSVTPSSARIVALLHSAVHGVLVIRLQYHISEACSLLRSFALRVHVSTP